MNPRKLIVTVATLTLLAGAGVAGAVAGNSTSSPAATTAPPTTTTCSDDQGQQGENDEQEAADAVENTATQSEVFNSIALLPNNGSFLTKAVPPALLKKFHPSEVTGVPTA